MLLRRCFQSLAKPALNIGGVGRFSTESQISVAEGDRTALAEEYKKEIKDLWEMYAMRRARRQCMVGIVTSTKNAKSITVTVTRQKLVKKYRKWISRRKRFMAHDEKERANVGDLVRIVPCNPKSRKKRHKLIDILIAEGQLPSKHDHEKNLELLKANLDPKTEEPVSVLTDNVVA